MRVSMQVSRIVVALILAVVSGACSNKPFLKVQYQLPPSSTQLEGRNVSVSVSDLRNADAILSQNAKKAMPEFKGTFSLIVLRTDGSGDLIGAYSLVPLITEIFQRRLKNIGIGVVSTPQPEDPRLEIALKQFSIDLSGRKWIVDMAYDANLIKDGAAIAGETISGSAERLRVTGTGEAEKVLGELITDMVNRLDLVKLFEQAGR